jgi:hypothetical protein
VASPRRDWIEPSSSQPCRWRSAPRRCPAGSTVGNWRAGITTDVTSMMCAWTRRPAIHALRIRVQGHKIRLPENFIALEGQGQRNSAIWYNLVIRPGRRSSGEQPGAAAKGLSHLG